MTSQAKPNPTPHSVTSDIHDPPPPVSCARLPSGTPQLTEGKHVKREKPGERTHGKGCKACHLHKDISRRQRYQSPGLQVSWCGGICELSLLSPASSNCAGRILIYWECRESLETSSCVDLPEYLQLLPSCFCSMHHVFCEGVSQELG